MVPCLVCEIYIIPNARFEVFHGGEESCRRAPCLGLSRMTTPSRVKFRNYW